jgi:hypothetical protein
VVAGVRAKHHIHALGVLIIVLVSMLGIVLIGVLAGVRDEVMGAHRTHGFAGEELLR